MENVITAQPVPSSPPAPTNNEDLNAGVSPIVEQPLPVGNLLKAEAPPIMEQPLPIANGNGSMDPEVQKKLEEEKRRRMREADMEPTDCCCYLREDDFLYNYFCMRAVADCFVGCGRCTDHCFDQCCESCCNCEGNVADHSEHSDSCCGDGCCGCGDQECCNCGGGDADCCDCGDDCCGDGCCGDGDCDCDCDCFG